MNELAETVHGGAARGAAGAGLAKLVLFFAFAVFTVNAGESADRVRAFVGKAGDDFRTVLDNGRTMSVRYGVRTVPTMVLVDRRGTVRWIHVGHLPETGELRDLLHRLAGE